MFEVCREEFEFNDPTDENASHGGLRIHGPSRFDHLKFEGRDRGIKVSPSPDSESAALQLRPRRGQRPCQSP